VSAVRASVLLAVLLVACSAPPPTPTVVPKPPTRAPISAPTPTAPARPTAPTKPPAKAAGDEATADVYNCADFPSQAAAQAFLRRFPADPSKLDTDRNGIACEANPAPVDRTPVKR